MSVRARLSGLLTVLAVLASPIAAQADSGGATIRSLPESSELQVAVEVRHDCPGYAYGPTESCTWFATAAAYGSESGCPVVFDSSHGVWVGRVETFPGTSYGSFAFNPYNLPRLVVVCLYVNGESEEQVGQSHPFDRLTGREVLPPPPEPPPSPEASLDGLRECERPNPVGAFLAASPSVSCRTARVVRARLFGRGYFATRSTPCENRTFCVVMGFRCYGRYAGRLRRFSYAHHASCRARDRRIVVDIG